MGKKSLSIILFFLLSLATTSLFAQQKEKQETTTVVNGCEETPTAPDEDFEWKDWMGVQLSVLSSNIDFVPFNYCTGTLPEYSGINLELGLLMDKKSEDPAMLSLGFLYAQTYGVKGELFPSSLFRLNLGGQSVVMNVFNTKPHRISLEGGVYGSMCVFSAKSLDKKVYRWGLVGRTAVTYSYTLAKGFVLGGKFYTDFGKYFGKNYFYPPFDFSHFSEWGIGLTLSY